MARGGIQGQQTFQKPTLAVGMTWHDHELGEEGAEGKLLRSFGEWSGNGEARGGSVDHSVYMSVTQRNRGGCCLLCRACRCVLMIHFLFLSLRPPPDGLGLIAQDQVKVIDVAGTLAFGAGTLMTARSTFIALEDGECRCHQSRLDRSRRIKMWRRHLRNCLRRDPP